MKLTNREAQILQLLKEGKSNSEIADLLHLSIHTVKSHVSSILTKKVEKSRVMLILKH